jgi:chromosome partitioning protein
MPRSKPAAHATRGRIVLLSSPKGGVGKSSLARNLLVSAAKAHLRVVGLDFDRQATLAKWAERRTTLRESFPELPEVDVRVASLSTWRGALDAVREGADLIVADTPPSVEDHMSASIALSTAAALVLVPCGPTQDDVDSAAPWMRTMAEAGVKAAFVLNRANRRTRSYEMMRAKLLQAGPVCPVEIPLLEDIHLSGAQGLGVLDVRGAKAGPTFDSLWTYVSREAGL